MNGSDTIVVVSYDISDDKKRERFSKFLKKFGHRIQYSVFEIDNSEKILDNIIAEIENRFRKDFSQEDSVYIFKMNPNCDIRRYGYAANEPEDYIIVK